MITRIILVATIALLTFAGSLKAQFPEPNPGLHQGPTARPFSHGEELLHVDYFDYDAQMWAPFDVTAMDGRIKPHTGFYFAFDFVHASLSRPEAVPGFDPRLFPVGSDFVWGNRTTFGWMSELDKGIHFSWLRTDDDFFAHGEDFLVARPFSLATEVNSVNINRTFRQSLHNGGYIEPYVGARYFAVNDNTLQDRALLVTTATDFRFRQNVINSAAGAQIGARYFRRYGRWQVSGESSLAALYNSQRYRASNLFFVRDPDTLAIIDITAADFTLQGTSFVPVWDLDLTLSFNVTRDISIRAGAIVMFAWDGIARANTTNLDNNPFSFESGLPLPTSFHQEGVTMAGATFGVDWRR